MKDFSKKIEAESDEDGNFIGWAMTCSAKSDDGTKHKYTSISLPESYNNTMEEVFVDSAKQCLELALNGK